MVLQKLESVLVCGPPAYNDDHASISLTLHSSQNIRDTGVSSWAKKSGKNHSRVFWDGGNKCFEIR